MAGFGSIQGMISSLKGNANLSKGRSAFSNKTTTYGGLKKAYNSKRSKDFRTLTDKEKLEIKKRIRQSNRKEEQKKLLIFGVVIIVFLLAVYFFFSSIRIKTPKDETSSINAGQHVINLSFDNFRILENWIPN